MSPTSYLAALPRDQTSGGGGRIRTSEGVSQQIYSLPRLAAPEPLRINPLGAGGRVRTVGPLLTRQALFLLSYASGARGIIARPSAPCKPLAKHFLILAVFQVPLQLPLHPLQGIIDGLYVPVEAIGNFLV